MSQPAPPSRPRLPPARVARVAGYGICAWSLLFALPHLYWGLGYTAGIEATLGEVPRDPLFVAFGTWGVFALCLVGAVFGLAVARPWGRWIPRQLLLAGAVTGAVLFGLHGVQVVVQFGLIRMGVLRVRDDPAFWVHVQTQLFLWGPWFLLGGLLFGAAAWALWPPLEEPEEPT